MANSKKKRGKNAGDRNDGEQREDEPPRTGDPIIITGGRASLQPSTDSPEEFGDQTSGEEKE